ncbi:MAG: hypothetical protein K6A41_02820 [Bacteroidales bacterium]|nr:hypothetical protein [Bacteroidales bacterium]
MSRLLIDAGATKTAFAVIEDKRVLFRCSEAGINVNYTPEEDIRSRFKNFIAQYSDYQNIRLIEYYGAGCATSENQEKMRNILRDFFQNASLTVDTDLMVVCRALSSNRTSIIGILGTGAATCLFDGQKIAFRAPSLGYMLGDEGSGTNLGKRLLTNYLSGQLPKELQNELEKQHNLTFQNTIHRLYSEPKPNQFMSSLSPFIHEHLSHPFIQQMVVKAFQDFFSTQKQHYPKAEQLSWQLSGSIAHHYENQVREAAAIEQCSVEQIISDPLEKMIANLVG